MKRLTAQIGRFCMVGVSAFAIDYALLIFLTEVFQVNYLISATISFSVSVVYNYFMSMRFVFSHKENLSRRREFIIFVILAVSGLALNNLLIWVGVELLFVDYRIVKVFVGITVGVWNFTTRKVFLDSAGWKRPLRAETVMQVYSNESGSSLREN